MHVKLIDLGRCTASLVDDMCFLIWLPIAYKPNPALVPLALEAAFSSGSWAGRADRCGHRNHLEVLDPVAAEASYVSTVS